MNLTTKKRDAKIEMIFKTVVYLRIGTKKMKCSKRKKWREVVMTNI